MATLEATGISSFCSDIKFCPNIQFLHKHPAFARISSFCPNIQLLLEHPVFVRISSFSSDIRFSTEYSVFTWISSFCSDIKFPPKIHFSAGSKTFHNVQQVISDAQLFLFFGRLRPFENTFGSSSDSRLKNRQICHKSFRGCHKSRIRSATLRRGI